MNDKQLQDLLARRMAGHDVAQGEPRISYEPILPSTHPDDEVKDRTRPSPRRRRPRTAGTQDPQAGRLKFGAEEHRYSRWR